MADFLDLSAISSRLKELYERSGMTAKDYSSKIGVAASTFSSIINEKQEVNVAMINKVIASYPIHELDPYWFLFGVAQSVDPVTRVIDHSYDHGEEVAGQIHILLDRIEQQSAELARLRSELALRGESKQIEHIAVFYSDNSYARYYSEEHEG